MPRVLLLCPPDSYRVAAYLQAAKGLGLDLVIGSRGEHSLVTELARGLHLDLHNKDAALEAIVEFAAQRPLAGILASDDATVELAALAADVLGLRANSLEASRLARRKDLARAHLARHGLPVPAHRLVDLRRDIHPQLAGFPLPAVAKPLGLSASRGVIRADTVEQLADACERIRAILAGTADPFEGTHVLLESYLDGVEVAADGLLQDGRLRPLALFDKPEPLTGPYFEESYYITPSRLDARLQGRIWAMIEQGCACYGLRHGPVHAELRVSGEGPVILEIASRTIGGDCARMFDDTLPQSLEALALCSLAGLPLQVPAAEMATGVLMIPIPRAGVLRRVEGIEAAASVEGVREVRITALPGHELQTLPEGASYLGFVFARAETPAQVEQALRTAHANLRPIIDPFWRLERV